MGSPIDAQAARLPWSGGKWVRPHPSRRRRAVDTDAAELSPAQGRLPRHLGSRRWRGAAALRRGPFRPRHPRPDAASPRRGGSLPAAALSQPGPDHHADRERQRDRQGGRSRGRRRRLHHQALLDARVPQPGQSGTAPLPDGRRGRRRGVDRVRRTDDRLRSPDGDAGRGGGTRHLRRVRDPRRPGALARSRPHPRDPARARLGDSEYRDPRTVDVHIRHLREKLERDPKQPDFLFTVRGVGYRFKE